MKAKLPSAENSIAIGMTPDQNANAGRKYRICTGGLTDLPGIFRTKNQAGYGRRVITFIDTRSGCDLVG